MDIFAGTDIRYHGLAQLASEIIKTTHIKI